MNKIPKEVINKFHSILVSVDGRPDVTNEYRGKGVFEKVTENVNNIKHEFSFNGELIARMTVSQKSDIFLEVTELFDHEKNLGFSHVHWQLDVLWNSETWINLQEWLDTVYNPGIHKLIQWWLENITKHGIVFGVVPFLGIISTLLSKKSVQLRCGAGVSSFTVSTDGSLLFCPICPEEPDATVGSIQNPNEISKVHVTESCTSCEALNVCGGRCLYTNFFKYASSAEYKAVCAATIFLINELRKILPEVKELINNGKISLDQLIYPEINNSTEIIP